MAARKGASRRQVLKLVGVGAVGAVGASLVITARTKPNVARSAPRSPTPKPAPAAVHDEGQAWLGDLVGRQLGAYRVVSVGAIARGGIPVEMSAKGGATFRVDVLRYDEKERLRGIGAVGAVSVYLRNGGKGGKSTDETQGLGAMALARELVRRERAGATPPRGLRTMGERARLDDTAVNDAAVT